MKNPCWFSTIQLYANASEYYESNECILNESDNSMSLFFDFTFVNAYSLLMYFCLVPPLMSTPIILAVIELIICL